MTITHASLFSGIGGPEVAAAMLGWKNAFHCEINPFGRAILEYWFPDSVSYEDITKTNFYEWRGKIDVLTGGFPCQPFSYAGKRGGREDDRYLWPEMLRVIDQIRPTWVIGENVAGLSTMVEGGVCSEMGCDTSFFGEDNGVYRYQFKETFTIERICRDLECHGYSVQPMLIPAACVGAPHRRDRIFILANALDSHRGAEMRGSQDDAGKGGTERVQERHKVQRTGESGDVREDVADPHRNRGGKVDKHLQSKLPDGTKSFRNGGQRDAADTIGKRLERQDHSGGAETGRSNIRRNPAGCDWANDGRLLCGERWREFPTVSPVHRGNDGIPFDVDYLTIPFSKWRTESLKAYGNAIVPQVMYEIFLAIQSVMAG